MPAYGLWVSKAELHRHNFQSWTLSRILFFSPSKSCHNEDVRCSSPVMNVGKAQVLTDLFSPRGWDKAVMYGCSGFTLHKGTNLMWHWLHHRPFISMIIVLLILRWTVDSFYIYDDNSLANGSEVSCSNMGKCVPFYFDL